MPPEIQIYPGKKSGFMMKVMPGDQMDNYLYPVNCDPEDIALKSVFLGPRAENAAWFERQWQNIAHHWVNWRRNRFASDRRAISEADQDSDLFQLRQREVELRLSELLRALDQESPKFTPRYLGHMTSELALPALLGHAAVLLHNPNLTSKDVSAVTSKIESEAIADLLRMLGFSSAAGRGHFTCGGTVANLEGLWRALHRYQSTLALELYLLEAGKIRPEELTTLGCRNWEWFDLHSEGLPLDCLNKYSLLHLGPAEFSETYFRVTGKRYRSPLVMAPCSRHFSWPKAVTLAGLGRDSLQEIPLDDDGRLSIQALAHALAKAKANGRPVLMAISVAGGTSSGSVDPVHEVQNLIDVHQKTSGESIWHHVDAAYGGYFCSLLHGPTAAILAPRVRHALAGIARANSVTLDPHKLGYVPYSCGAIVVRDASDYRCPSFDAPYLLTGDEGSWRNTIEGSRAATGAVATWMANRTIGLDANGYGRILARSLASTGALVHELARAQEFISLAGPADLNVLCFFFARNGESLTECNRRTLSAFQAFRESPDFSVSKTELKLSDYSDLARSILAEKSLKADAPGITCLRIVLMNPFFKSRESGVQYEELFVNELLRLAQQD